MISALARVGNADQPAATISGFDPLSWRDRSLNTFHCGSMHDMHFFCYRSRSGRIYHEMSDQTTGATVSDYDAIGGGPAVSAVVNDFYMRVLADPQLVPYFEGVDIPRLKRHQVLLVTQVLGGPANYDGRPLAEAHAGLGIEQDDFAAVASHLTAAMNAAGVPEDIVMRAMATVAATEPDIVESRSP